MAKKRTKRYMSREARKKQIYSLLLTASRPVTRGEILRHIKLTHSGWTNELFEEMVREKYLLPPVTKRRGLLEVVYYEANDLGKDNA